MQDAKLGGWDVKVNDRVMLYSPAADLDEHVFPQPEKFDIARENNTHLLFGNGPHRCVGLHLARLELQTLYCAILERLPIFRLDPNEPVEYRVTQNFLMTKLPLRWD
ncbi:MAG TPA: cytochrome P450 [Spongiibacteraceae bacterium]|nr:cytochrome P450 [Spongiibacteraceae bacterium]